MKNLRKATIINFLIFGLSIVFLSLRVVSAADKPYNVDVTFLSEPVEVAFEFVNTIIAIGVSLLAFRLSNYLKGSQLEKGWKIIILSTVLFIIKEIYGALNAINILHITGMRDILEFFSMFFLFYGLLVIFRTYSQSD